MSLQQVLADSFVGVSLAGALYEAFALVSGRVTPPITTLARKWRKDRSPLLFLVLIPWLGLGWHLFVQP